METNEFREKQFEFKINLIAVFIRFGTHPFLEIYLNENKFVKNCCFDWKPIDG